MKNLFALGFVLIVGFVLLVHMPQWIDSALIMDGTENRESLRGTSEATIKHWEEVYGDTPKEQWNPSALTAYTKSQEALQSLNGK